MAKIRLASSGTRLSFGCSAAEAVGDLVAVSAPGAVVRCDPTVLAKMPAIGIIVAKPSATTCVVLTRGRASVAGVVAAQRYFVGATGQPTLIVPSPGPAGALVQVVGLGLDTDVLFIEPSPDMTKRVL